MSRRVRTHSASIGVALIAIAAISFFAFVPSPPLAGALAALTVGVIILTVAGLENLGLTVLTICFFLAPFFRAFPIVPGTAITAVDPLLLVAVGLLLPRILRGRVDVSPLYLGSALTFITIGYAAAFASPAAPATIDEITQWAFLAVALALAFMALDLTRSEIAKLAIAYILGQMLSSAIALAQGPDAINGRYQGLAAHPNYFGDGAMMAACLLLYLYHEPRAKSVVARWLWWTAMAVCLIGIYVSGSRGAALGAAAVFVLVPLIERSGVAAFIGTLTLAAAALFLQPVAQSAGQGSTLARLTGNDGTGTRTTSFRLQEWNEALSQIANAPWLGHGLSLEVLSYHNNYLSIAAGVGVIAAAVYLIALWCMGRGLFGPSAERRLLYPMVAFAVFGLTQPGFKDRSNWLPMLLGLALFHGYRLSARDRKSMATLSGFAPEVASAEPATSPAGAAQRHDREPN